jgi:threonine dehydrogenase-like Zn-dependent dehydrogenase
MNSKLLLAVPSQRFTAPISRSKLVLMSNPHPPHYRALQLDSVGADLQIVERAMPKADIGSAIIRIEAAEVLSYHRDVYNGNRHYTFPTPIVGGLNAIGRIAALGPDATTLTKGQLVYLDCVIRARDDPDTLYLSAIHDSGAEGSKKLMRDVWRDGAFAEYVKFPLENCIPLNETVLCKELGYSTDDLIYLGHLTVPFGGLRDIRLEPGETVVVCPATGGYGGAGVQMAIAMGARVIAMGRNERELARLKEHIHNGTPKASIQTVKITGDEAADLASLKSFGVIDAVLDFTPPQASKSTHLRAATSALRRNGRASLMGFVDQPVHPWHCVARNITLKGKLMYERDDIVQLAKILERGLFPRAEAFVRTEAFGLDDWKAAFDRASEYTGSGRQVVLKPQTSNIDVCCDG